MKNKLDQSRLQQIFPSILNSSWDIKRIDSLPFVYVKSTLFQGSLSNRRGDDGVTLKKAWDGTVGKHDN